MPAIRGDAARAVVAVPENVSVVFTPSGLRGEFPPGTTVLQAARELSVDLESICGGQGQCHRCQVVHALGQFPKYGINSRPHHLSAPAELERTGDDNLLGLGRRLGCCTRLLGDVVIDIPADSQIHRQHIAKEITVREITRDPAVKLYSLQLPAADMLDPRSDLRCLQDFLQREFGLHEPGCELTVLQELQSALIDNDRKVTLAVYQSGLEQPQIIAVWPTTKARVFGMAVDLGSTTIAAHLCDLSNGEVVATTALMNPQIRFGEDLMSRVSYVMLNQGGGWEMTRAVRKAFSDLAADAALKAGIPLKDILELAVVCNPIMHHLLLGIDPTPLGSAPFTLATDRAVLVKAAELGLDLHPQSRVYILPCLAGHVGADTAGMILSERPDLGDEITLLVDVGTNAELVLGNRHRLLAASSPTGPAFEGAQISCGQRATIGAVERVRIDRETLEPRYKVIGCDLWSNDPGFAQATKNIGISGICGSGIIELVAELFLAKVIDAQGVISAEMAEKTPRILAAGRTFTYVLHQGEKTLSLTQKDIRAIQLAKAALYAGVRLLMDHLGVDKVDRIKLAGAFGSHIDVKYAMVLGLIPDCDLQFVGAVGNAAGNGARMALLDRSKRVEIDGILRRVEKIETAIEARFQEHFVEALGIPHSRHQFLNLARVVSLPEQSESDESAGKRGLGGKRGRRRRRTGFAS